jgi:hypothetical protein
MIVLDNPEMRKIVMETLANKYQINQPREGLHLSSLVYCLTKYWFDKRQFVKPTETELMLFVVGYGLQDAITPENATIPTYEKDGIIYRPDFELKMGETELGEIKTTRMSQAKQLIPDTWQTYIKGGLFIREQYTYNLAILYICGNYKPPFPMLETKTLVFDEDEILDNWGMLIERKAVIELSDATGIPPQPKMWCSSWECDNCRYALKCGLLAEQTEETEEEEEQDV